MVEENFPYLNRSDERDTYDLFQQGRAPPPKGMPAQATVSLEKAKQREPDKASIREALGIAYFRIQRWDEAEAEFRALLELSPTDDYAHYALGRCLEKQGRLQEANGHYKLASSLRPGSRRTTRSRIRDLDELARARRRPARASKRACASTGDAWRRDRAGALRAPRRGRGDDAADAERLAGKIARLRIFENDEGSSTARVLDVGGAALVVSQFTLIADTAEGQPAVVCARRAAGAGGAAVRALLRRARASSASRSRAASSARGWRSSS